jgi:hypothetical protein
MKAEKSKANKTETYKRKAMAEIKTAFDLLKRGILLI